MITLKDIHLQRGTKTLFDGLNLTIHHHQKIGLIGINGSGKTSLFKLLLRELKEDAGDFYMPPTWCIAHLEQETPALSISALDYVLQGDALREKILAQLAIAEAEHDGMEIAELHMQLHDIDGYTTPVRAAQLLDGLGFSPEKIHQTVASFSGGWRVRLNLARVLISRSELLILDEPTNHLDLEAIVWLENWLKQYPSSMIIISHDRDFLDNTINTIAHLSEQKIKVYTGNYSDFEKQRAEQLIIQQKTFEKMQQKREHLQSFVDRFRAKATKAKQAQSRIKALEKLPQIQAAHMDSPFTFEIPNPLKQPNPLLQLLHVDAGYQHKTILKDLSITIAPGKRVGLLGLNGAGKSTLIKLLADQIPMLKGERTLHPDTKIGYFAQHQIDYLHLDQSPLQHLQALSPQIREQELRDYLGSFNFRGDQALGKIAPFSGGEKSRLALALLIWQRPNLLLLDEPTNHLDREMREALTQALQLYEGAMIIVSHDRHLLRASCDEFYLVEGGKAEFFSEDLDDYIRWRQQQKAQAETTKSSSNEPVKKAAATNHQPRIREIETRLIKLQKELTQLDEKLQDMSLYEKKENQTKLSQLQQKRQQNLTEIAQLEDEWLRLS